jgi:hypothetical protein
MVMKWGSRQFLSSPHINQIVEAKGGSRQPLPFSDFNYFDYVKRWFEAVPFLPPFLPF